MELYHCVSARSFRVLWALEELQLTYQLKMLPFPPRAYGKDYFAINPLGTVPAFKDGEVWMSESCAILQYLAEKYGQNFKLKVDDLEYGSYLNFLHYGEATITFPQTLILRYSQFESENMRNLKIADDYKKWVLSRMRLLETHLEGREFICGERMTMADISAGYALYLGDFTHISSEYTPNIAAYLTRLKCRSAFKQSLAIEKNRAIDLNLSPEFARGFSA